MKYSLCFRAQRRLLQPSENGNATTFLFHYTKYAGRGQCLRQRTNAQLWRKKLKQIWNKREREKYMSPLIWGNWRRDLAADISEIWWEIQLKIKTNPCSHTFEAVNESASNFERVFRHFVMNLSEQKLLHINMNVRGRADNSSPPSLVHNKWLNFTSTFSAPALRGLRHSSHKSKLQWDEQACLASRVSHWGLG